MKFRLDTKPIKTALLLDDSSDSIAAERYLQECGIDCEISRNSGISSEHRPCLTLQFENQHPVFNVGLRDIRSAVITCYE